MEEIDELKNKKKYLEIKNKDYQRQIKMLKQELGQINISISSAKEYSELYEERKKKYIDNIAKMKIKKSSLIRDINNLELKIKAAEQDEESALALRDLLNNEFDNIQNKKSIILKKMNQIKEGIDEILKDKKRKLPHLKEYDELLREARNVFKEVESRIEVSLKLRGGT